MGRELRKIGVFLHRNEKAVLAAMILFYVAVMTAVCLWKYGIFAYNGLDLAILNQVFWNTLQGRFFAGSIHPHLYLGDHAELAIPLLMPFYALFPDPRTLLMMQTLALALPAWPLWLIAKRRLAGSALPATAVKLLPLLAAFVYLANPFVQNINLFEFHILPFALLPLFLAMLEYEKGRKWPFLAFAALALLVREDVALVLGAVGILAWAERRPWFWRLAPLLLSGLWFISAMKLISFFAPAGGYKFMIYYSWLGGTPAQMALNALIHPVSLLAHIATLANFEMVLGFAMPLMFVIFLRPKRLLLAAGPLLQVILSGQGGGELILQMHYATLFLPALFLAAIEGARALPAVAARMSDWGFIKAPLLLSMILVAGGVFSGAVFSPLPAVAARMIAPANDLTRAVSAEALLERIPPDASVAAGYALLPRLSSRSCLYSLHYQFLGVSQFGLSPYALPEDTRFVAMDTSDLVVYATQYLGSNWGRPHYPGGFGRLRRTVGAPVFSRGSFILFDKKAVTGSLRPRIPRSPAVQNFSGGIALLGSEVVMEDDPLSDAPLLRIGTVWAADESTDADLVMRLRLIDSTGEAAVDQNYPLANGLLPTSEMAGQEVAGEVSLPLAGLKPGTYYPEISLEKQDAIMNLDGIRSAVRIVTDRVSFGSVQLPSFDLAPDTGK